MRTLNSEQKISINDQYLLSREMRGNGRYAEAIQLTELALKALEGCEASDLPLAINLLRTKVVYLLESRRGMEGLSAIETALQYAETLQDDEERGSCHYHRARCFGESGRPAESFADMEAALTLRKNPFEKLRMTIRLGEFNYKAGKVVEGIQILERVIVDLKELYLTNIDEKLTKPIGGELGVAYTRLAEAYLIVDKYNEALDAIEKEIMLSKHFNPRALMPNQKENLRRYYGEVQKNCGLAETFEELYERLTAKEPQEL